MDFNICRVGISYWGTSMPTATRIVVVIALLRKIQMCLLFFEFLSFPKVIA